MNQRKARKSNTSTEKQEKQEEQRSSEKQGKAMRQAQKNQKNRLTIGKKIIPLHSFLMEVLTQSAQTWTCGTCAG